MVGGEDVGWCTRTCFTSVYDTSKPTLPEKFYRHGARNCPPITALPRCWPTCNLVSEVANCANASATCSTRSSILGIAWTASVSCCS